MFKNKIAIGIEVQVNDKKEKFFARKEVLLSAGSINSPKLLQLSGIGDSNELKKMDIDIIQDLLHQQVRRLDWYSYLNLIQKLKLKQEVKRLKV